jgi:hypothetical protein
MSYKLTSQQKDEIRRLTQLANRRIKAAQRAYEKEGKTVLPRDVVGDYQTKQQWATASTPISRSVRFESEEAYRRQLRDLKRFEVSRPGVREYTRTQRNKATEAVRSTLGDITPSLENKLGKMTAPQLADFWRDFQARASRQGMQYSSQAVLIETMSDFFPEDREALEGV